MCGISGIINKNKIDTRSAVNLMTASMVHRGPDNKGILKLKNCDGYFGHNRLSIIELSNHGDQPMRFKHLTITYNGEVYNFNEIKSQLINYGYSFVGNSDTEVILKAFDYWGVNCVEKFIGMFAFSIHDSLKNKIYLFRDRAGVKPLYFSNIESCFIFASEQKAILQLVKSNVNHQSISDYIHNGYVNNLNTFYSDINEIKQGSFLTYDILSNNISLKSYWSSEDIYLSNNKTEFKNYFEAKMELKTLLESSFNYRMVSDVPVGVFLSSGFDSTLVAAILSKDKDINTFTIGFKDKKYDESEKAKNIAKHLKTNHTEIICSAHDIEEFINDLPLIYDEPFGDTSCLPTLLVNKHASKHVKVVLSADGGDEQFGGYSHYDLNQSIYDYYDLFQKIGPLKKLRKPLLSIIDKINNNNISLLPKIETLKLFGLNKNDFIYNYHVERSHLVFYSNHFLNKDLKPNKNFNIKNKYEQDNWRNLLMLNDYNNYMVNILKKVDRASMFSSIESREPFLDHRIYEFSTKLPFEHKINNNIKKKIIRDLVYDYVPKNLMEQKKVGFGIPITDWFRTHLKDYFIETFNEDSIKKSQFFNSSNVLKFRDNFLKTNNKNYYTNQMIWRLFTINQWENQYRKYIIT